MKWGVAPGDRAGRVGEDDLHVGSAGSSASAARRRRPPNCNIAPARRSRRAAALPRAAYVGWCVSTGLFFKWLSRFALRGCGLRHAGEANLRRLEVAGGRDPGGSARMQPVRCGSGRSSGLRSVSSSRLLAAVARTQQDLDDAVAVVALARVISPSLTDPPTPQRCLSIRPSASKSAAVPRNPRTSRHHPAGALLAVEPYAQRLFVGRQGFGLFHLVGGVLEVGIGRIDHSQPRFPIVSVVLFHVVEFHSSIFRLGIARTPVRLCTRLNEMVGFLSSISRLGIARTSFGSALGLTKWFVFNSRFLAMAKLAQARLCPFGLAKTFVFVGSFPLFGARRRASRA